MKHNLTELQSQIEAIIRKTLPGFQFGISLHKECIGTTEYLKIWMACSPVDINKVAGQKPQIVSLYLNDRLELKPQIYGGNGGRVIYREPNKELREEKYLAMKNEVIPFRTPKPEIPKILKCIETFCKNYLELLRKHKSVLKYQTECGGYEFLG